MRYAFERATRPFRHTVSAGFFCGLLALSLQFAGTATAAAQTTNDTFFTGNLFEARRWEANISSGVLFSPMGSPQKRPVINYTITSLELGYMLTDIHGPGILRGNLEVAGDIWASQVFVGPGTFIAGGTLWIRYNFVPAGWRLIPYVQLGAGLTATDLDVSYVGQAFNFNLDAALGVRYLFAKNWSVNLMCQYQHISNANTGPKNVGINSFGPILGVSYFF